MRRAVGDGEAGRGHVVDIVGQQHHVVGARHRLLGEGAVGDHGQHPLPRLQAAHARAHGLDLAGELEARA